VHLSQGYLQITLAKESRHITAFPTPDDSSYRFKRLIMGACPSEEYFHEAINQVIKEIPNCRNISDNIWLWPKNKKEHLKQLDQLLGTLEENGITLKFAKCSFAVQQINVFGMYVCMYLISLEMLSSSAIRLVFMRGVYLAIYKYIKMKKKLINPQTPKEYYPEHNV
jgi:hypothetical protein